MIFVSCAYVYVCYLHIKVKNANKNAKPGKQSNHIHSMFLLTLGYIQLHTTKKPNLYKFWYIFYVWRWFNGMRPQARLNPSSSLYHYLKCWYVLANIFIHKQNTTGSECERVFFLRSASYLLFFFISSSHLIQ